MARRVVWLRMSKEEGIRDEGTEVKGGRVHVGLCRTLAFTPGRSMIWKFLCLSVCICKMGVILVLPRRIVWGLNESVFARH